MEGCWRGLIALVRPRHVSSTSCGDLSCLWRQVWFLEVRHQHASSRSRFADAYYVRGRKWVRSGRFVEISKIEDTIVWSLIDFTSGCCAFWEVYGADCEVEMVECIASTWIGDMDFCAWSRRCHDCSRGDGSSWRAGRWRSWSFARTNAWALSDVWELCCWVQL